MAKIIACGDDVDQMTVGALCEAAAREIIAFGGEPRDYRIDLYREVRIDGRTMFVRVKLTIPFTGRKTSAASFA